MTHISRTITPDPALGHTFAYGGISREQARAAADSWHTVLAFLGGSQP